MKTVRIATFVCSLLVALGLPTAALAIIQFDGAGTSDARPVSATAYFVVSDNQIVLTLANTTALTFSDDQLLTGIQFGLSTGTLDLSLTNILGAERNVAANGTFTDSNRKDLTTTWGKIIGADFIQLVFNGGTSTPAAEHSIIGAPNSPGSPGSYAGSDDSIQGHPGHNPFIPKAATFTITGNSIDPGAAVSDVTFFFNTGLSVSIPGTSGTPPPIPEPGTVAFGIALLGVTALSRQRRSPAAG